MHTKRVRFENDAGHKLSGLLDLPVDDEPIAYALFAQGGALEASPNREFPNSSTPPGARVEVASLQPFVDDRDAVHDLAGVDRKGSRRRPDDCAGSRFDRGSRASHAVRPDQRAGSAFVAAAEHPFARHAGHRAGDVAHGFEFGPGDSVFVSQTDAIGAEDPADGVDVAGLPRLEHAGKRF